VSKKGHASAVSGALKRPFDEQVKFFRGKLGNLVPTERWDDMKRGAHDTGFMVAGATKADLLTDLAAAVDRTISEGKSIQAFRQDFRAIVERRGWHGWTGEGTAAGEAWRTRVIYTTNMSTSYAAARYQQLRDGGFDYWIYKHSGSQEPRPQHLAWDGLTLPNDHPFWRTHGPKNGWGCECYVVGARSERGVKRLGGDPGKQPPEGWDAIDPKTGAPVGIDKGWDYQPGRRANAVRGIAEKLGQVDPGLIRQLYQKTAALPAQLGARMADSWPDFVRPALADEFGGFVDQVLAERMPRGRLFVAGAMRPAWVDKMARHGALPATADIKVRDDDILHAFRDTKKHALPLDWYKRLPEHLAAPQAAILDTTHKQGPALLLIYHAEGSGKKLVLRINYRIKKTKEMTNIIGTGEALDAMMLRSIEGQLGHGYELLEGSL
jgi:hypothetical protein